MPEVQVGNITCQEGSHKDEKVEFHFNPAEYSIAKANRYHPLSNKGGNVPNWEFGGGDPRIVTLELLFDSSFDRENERGATVQEGDVRRDTNMLFDFMLVDDTLRQQDGRDSHLGRPPRCHLQWARDTRNHFPCYIASCDVTYLMFNSEGVPVRARVRMVLHEAVDPEQQAGTNPTSRGEPGLRVRQVQEGDRLDWIAFQEYGDANEWRRIAEANRIFDPLNLRPGMTLAISPR